RRYASRVKSTRIVVVRIKSRIVVVLYAEVLPTQAKVERQTIVDLPRILAKEGKIVEAVHAVELRLRSRKIQRAARRIDRRSIYAAGIAWNQPLRIDRNVVGVDRAVEQCIQRSAIVLGQIGDAFFIGAKDAVVLRVDVLSTEGEAVLALRPAQLIAKLIHVLRSAERNRIRS